MKCVCMCVVTEASGEVMPFWEKKKFMFSRFAEGQLHVFVFIVVCRDLETKEVAPNPPKLLGSVKLMCVELDKIHCFAAKTHAVKQDFQAVPKHNTGPIFRNNQKQTTTLEITIKLDVFCTIKQLLVILSLSSYTFCLVLRQGQH